MFFVGIDASLTATGLIILDDTGKIFNSTIISSKKKGMDRLVDLEKQVKKILSTYQPAKMIKVYVEGYSFGSRIGQAFSIGEWGGVLKKCLYELGYQVTLIPPTVLKKFVTGKGNAKKELMMLEVFKKWKESFNNNNLADAYGLARLAWAGVNQSKDKCLKYEWEVLNKVYELERFSNNAE